MTILITYLIGIFPLALLNYIMPSILRKNVFFGVTVPTNAKKENELVDILKQYRKRIVAGFIVLSVFYFISSTLIAFNKFNVIILATLTLYIIYLYFIYMDAWKKTKQVKKQKNWDIKSKNIAVASLNIKAIKTKISVAWFMLYPILIAVLGYIAYRYYLVAPDKIPLNYDFAGNITNYVDKSLRIFIPTLLTQCGIALLMFVLYFVNNRARVDIDPDNVTISGIQTAKYKYRWSIFVYVVGLTIILSFGFIQIAIIAVFSPTIIAITPIALTVFILAYALVLAIKTGQSGNRIKIGTENEQEIATKKDDDYWVGGLFYNNPNDPSLFIEKRSGIGYTINFGSKISWLLLAILIAFIARSIYFSVK